ncbi:hypothetical protein R4315_12315 [Rhodococcus oxybenzonivorans]|uniref:Transcriptional regulator n=1 Tax=Rhodococcus oxybenzonivorans TaxID=1990687 RepID=A0AAE5A671_9NOCA|nr:MULTISPECIES: hypothetical protein [Rhodococcus]MDV7245906.1 hypothetical protein [Rhodococcus oxybenzonivorans]MDV7265327.1 hypothetical protein [Rhodococcus oxybenzonivorans]MDV7277290.1 hypothetical protein [Rhodococcus oxybenzonivorans]MDV7336860.1 hypothetical protein [Rhodococcus oxybenzonivorans]MDV7347002.1 hypothetical protein [Rhodococcus oxybenzonivorans]
MLRAEAGSDLYDRRLTDLIGELSTRSETFPLGDGPSQFLLTYTAEPTSPSQDALNLLVSWIATNENIERSAPAHDSESS